VVPIVSIAGHSKSGKTTLIERLIGELKRRGRRVAAVKHTPEDFEMDRPGKDTWRYAQAGCQSVAILGPRRSAFLRHHDREYPYEEALRVGAGDVDLVLLEGLHSGPAPKIEVHRRELGRGLRCEAKDLLAVVTDEPLEIGCRQFPPDEVGAIADFSEKEVMGRSPGGTTLLVNDDPVPLNSFTQRIIASTILGMVSSLKGIGEVRALTVSIRTGAAAPRGPEVAGR